jgi:PAS domain S-box-containing protein
MNLCEQFAGAVVLTDLQGRVIFWSPAAQRRLGWLPAQTLNRPFREFVAHSAASTVLAELPRHAPTREIQSECRLLHADGSTLDLVLHTIPLWEESGEAYGFVQVLRELGRGKAEERQALDQANSKTIPVQRKLIHDFNNLLTSIHACLELASREEVSDRVSNFLKHAQADSLRAAQLARTFRATARELDSRSPAPVTGHTPGTPTVRESASGSSLEGTERILIAEDENSTRLLIRAILGYRGYQVTDAADGREAWARCEEAATPFDLAILDINMPGLGGREVFERLRKRWKDVAVLFLSGDAAEFPELSPAQKRFTTCLSKPFGNQELLQAVREILNQRFDETKISTP